MNMLCLLVYPFILIYIENVLGESRCAGINWDVVVCREGDEVTGQPDLIIPDGGKGLIDKSPVAIICRRPPCRAKYQGRAICSLIDVIDLRYFIQILYEYFILRSFVSSY